MQLLTNKIQSHNCCECIDIIYYWSKAIHAYVKDIVLQRQYMSTARSAVTLLYTGCHLNAGEK